MSRIRTRSQVDEEDLTLHQPYATPPMDDIEIVHPDITPKIRRLMATGFRRSLTPSPPPFRLPPPSLPLSRARSRSPSLSPTPYSVASRSPSLSFSSPSASFPTQRARVRPTYVPTYVSASPSRRVVEFRRRPEFHGPYLRTGHFMSNSIVPAYRPPPRPAIPFPTVPIHRSMTYHLYRGETFPTPIYERNAAFALPSRPPLRLHRPALAGRDVISLAHHVLYLMRVLRKYRSTNFRFVSDAFKKLASPALPLHRRARRLRLLQRLFLRMISKAAPVSVLNEARFVQRIPYIPVPVW